MDDPKSGTVSTVKDVESWYGWSNRILKINTPILFSTCRLKAPIEGLLALIKVRVKTQPFHRKQYNNCIELNTLWLITGKLTLLNMNMTIILHRIECSYCYQALKKVSWWYYIWYYMFCFIVPLLITTSGMVRVHKMTNENGDQKELNTILQDWGL